VNVKTKRVVISDFSGGIKGDYAPRLLPLNYATNAYNFNTINGSLTDGVGLTLLKFLSGKTLTSIEPILSTYYFKYFENGYKDKLLLYCLDKCVYCYEINSGELTKIENLVFENSPKGLSYRLQDKDIFIFSSQEGTFVFDGITATKVESVPIVEDICIHNERLFAVQTGEKTRLYFSDDFNPFNFNQSNLEGGFIDLVDERGGINKLVSNLGYLYLFRTHGISRLSSYYAQENFSVSHVFSCVGNIYPKSVTPCESGILFLAGDGIYMISGYSVKKVLSNLDDFFIGVDNFDSKGMFFKGCFYLKCKLKINGKQENALVVYRLKDDFGYIAKNLNVKDFCAIMGEDFSAPAIVAGNGKEVYTFCQSSSVCGVPLTKVWETPFTDLGVIGRDKILKKIEVYTNSQVKIIVLTEKSKKVFLLKPHNNYAVENVSVRGNEFKFIIESCTVNCEITKPMLTFSYV